MQYLIVTLCVEQDGGKDNETMLLSEAERQRILERKALDSEEEEAAAKKEEEEAAATAAAQKKKKKPAKGKKKSADDAEAEAEENGDEDDGENEDDGEEGEDGEKKKKGGKKKPVLKKALSRPQIVKEEEEQDKLLERLEKIEDPTFAPGKAVKANAHRGARVQAAKRSTARRIGAGAGRSSGGGRSRSGSSAKPRSRKRKTAEDDDEDDDGEDTKRPAKRARTTRRRGKRVGELDKTVKKVTSDPTFDEADGELRNKCCTLCSSREAIRAVIANDMPLLKKVRTRNDTTRHTPHDTTRHDTRANVG
jgi:hypothetical protein